MDDNAIKRGSASTLFTMKSPTALVKAKPKERITQTQTQEREHKAMQDAAITCQRALNEQKSESHKRLIKTECQYASWVGSNRGVFRIEHDAWVKDST